MSFAAVWIGVVVVIVVVGILLTRRQRDTAWKQLAAELGVEFIDGGMLHSSKVQAHVKQ
jgi:hypothetical protein